ncbi:hypothetical protein LSCM1_02640 [Leishmania martiniquensis]|uniref:RRM domain-containing protein n=1 Tax=Leishmania martiniquensis TaxID=1580590 RepID=A0A836H212_9TRYP|nr:hypothetical protein LSCM1_02640 [Leishmania martiniquensis]
MYNFMVGANAPSTMQQQQQRPTAPAEPPPVFHQATAGAILGGMTTRDASTLLINAAQRRQPSNLYSSCGHSLAAAAKQEWATVSDSYSTFPAPVARPSNSGVHSLSGIRKQPAQQLHQRTYAASLQSHEHLVSTTTPAPGPSLPLPQQHQQLSSAVILSGKSLRGHFDSAPFSPFTSTEVKATRSKSDASQQHYGNTSHLRLFHTSSPSRARPTPQAPALPQQNQQPQLPVSSNAWTAATAAAIMPPSPFASPSIQPLRVNTSPGYSYCVSGNAVPVPPANGPAPRVMSAAVPMPSQPQTAHSAASKTPPTRQTRTSTARPNAHPILIGHPTLSRSTAALLQSATSVVHMRPHCLTDASANELLGTTYYFEAVPRGDSLRNNSGDSYRSLIIEGTHPPPPHLQRHYLQPAGQPQHRPQWSVEQQPAYSPPIAHDGKINHFVTDTVAGGAATQQPPSKQGEAAPLTVVHSSAAGPEQSVALQPPLAMDESAYMGQSSGYQLQQQHQLIHQSSAAELATDARGIARRNRGRAVLFVGQLNYEATEADVSQVFSCYGKPLSVVVLKDKGKAAKKGGAGTGGSASAHRKVGGSAFVTYGSTLEADTAIMALHGRYNAKGDDPDSIDESKHLQVSYGQQTGLISTFGIRHAERLHALKPENPIPFLVRNLQKGSREAQEAQHACEKERERERCGAWRREER